MTAESKPKLLFIRHLDASFIRRDETMLASKYELVTFRFAVNKGWGIVPALFRQLLFLLKHLKNSKGVFVWFADFHAVLPVILSKALGKKSFIVIGGVDAAYDPVLAYGTRTRLLGRVSVTISCRMADQLLPVSEYTQQQLLNNIGAGFLKKSQVIYNCFDAPAQPASAVARENLVLTVCLSNKVKTLFVKGVDFYLELAQAMPDLRFLVVGVHGSAKEWIDKRKPANLIVLEPVMHNQLLELMHQSKVICQFSRHEAFGLALLEGIAAGCFPVGIRHAGTAEILQHSEGILIEDYDLQQAVNAIETAMNASEIQQQKIRNEVLPRFSCSKRMESLLKVIED